MLRSLNFCIKHAQKCLIQNHFPSSSINNVNKRCLHVNQITMIESLLEKHINEESPNWETFRNDVLAVDTRRISSENVDFLILSQCSAHERHTFALDYIKYLEKTGTTLNLATVSRLLKIYGYIQRQEESKITHVNIEEEILKIYNTLIEKHKVLDTSLTESVVFALSTTKQWRDCLKLKQNLELYDIPTGQTYDSLITALFTHGQEGEAWDLMQETIDKERTLGKHSINACLGFINSLKDYTKFAKTMERLFEFWSVNDILLNEDIATDLIAIITDRSQKAQITSISVQGDCRKCGTRLPDAKLPLEDFRLLKNAFFKRVIVGKDVFRKTTPSELAEFEKFVKERQHYDVIIDGLNVAYSTGTKKPVSMQSALVSSVVEHYAHQGKSVLVLGRNHMKKWPQIGRIRQNARLFLTQNLSHDDPYLLYCALNSGPGTIIVSRDMMRGHLYLLKDAHLKQLFKRWLSVSRYQLLKMGRDGKLSINMPPSFIISAQKHENVWHLPIMEKLRSDEKSSFPQRSLPTLWLCVQL